MHRHLTTTLRERSSVLLGAAALTLLATVPIGCRSGGAASAHPGAASGGPSARAVIEGKSGSTLHGWASFVEANGGVSVVIHVEAAPPGWHAVHVHENGDCSSSDGKSAGGHFNPGSTAHGSPHVPEHHAGDLGNMLVGDDGVGHHEIFMPELTVSDGPYSVVGRGIVVHAALDDLTTQPTGAAGGRIGCGVIR
jgi:Cu-Zn family superoxide dismutase